MLMGVAAAMGAAAAGAAETGDPAAGHAKYQQLCAGCHSVTDNRTGPAHRGVVGRKAGTFPGFEYSEALKASRIVWTRQTLDAWLTDPEKVIPGQAMFVNVADAKARADVIAYLATLPK